MSSPIVLAAVSSAIRRILWNSFTADPTVRPLVGTEEAIVFLNPTQTARDSGNRVSLWLYLIAENKWRSGALVGATPDQAFFVQCDRTTMTQDDIDNGRLICLVGMAPAKPAEFVIFLFSQLTGQVTS